MNVRRSEVSGRGEVPGVGANLDGEGTAVTKVENHGLPSVHSPARLDLPVLYGRYRFADGLENRLQFVLGGGPIILGCSPLLACWLSIRAPSASCGRPLPSDTAHLTLAWPCPTRPGAVKRRQVGYKRALHGIVSENAADVGCRHVRNVQKSQSLYMGCVPETAPILGRIRAGCWTRT